MARRAHSIDGRRFAFTASLSEAVPIGSYVRIVADNGRSYLGQVLEEEVVDPTSRPDSAEAERAVTGRGVLLARLGESGSERVGSTDVFGSSTVAEADSNTVASHLGTWTSDGARLNLGTIGVLDDVPALLAAKGFGRHTFLCGQSGSGKTYTLGLLLEQLLLETDLRIAVLDPNSDYVNIGSLRPREQTGLDVVEYDALTERFAPIASRVHVFGGPSSERRLQARLGALSREQQGMVLGIDPIGDPEEYNAFLRTTSSIEGEDYTLEDVEDRLRGSFRDDERRLGMRIENLGVADLSIWARRGENSIREQLPSDWRMLVFDLGSLPSDTERSIAAAAVLGEYWRQRPERVPLLIVIDEAHNICPQVPVDANQALATEHAVKIAGEGRKFGKYLLLATQRPEKLHQNVVSQCDNLVLMRMNSLADLEQLKRTFSFVPPSLIEQAAGFGLGEGLVAGKVAPNPIQFRTGRRYTLEGGSDVPADWASRPVGT
jgi:DNA helicase HerA-like ATPase